MPVRRAHKETPTSANCNGIVSSRGRVAWELVGACTGLATGLAEAEGGGGYELAHVIELVEDLVVPGEGLETVSFFKHELAEDGPFNAWLERLCVEARQRLAECIGRVEVAEELKRAATALHAAGEFAATTYAIRAADFVSTKSLWEEALQGEADVAAALAKALPAVKDDMVQMVEGFTVDMLFPAEGPAGAAGWREMEMLCGTRLVAINVERGVSFVLHRACRKIFEGQLEGTDPTPDYMSVKEALVEVIYPPRCVAPSLRLSFTTCCSCLSEWLQLLGSHFI